MSDPWILIVDDDSSVRRIIARTFEKAGFNVGAAANGEKAIALLEETRFDIMISDIDMPRMDGQELCRHLTTEGPYLPKHTLIVTGQMEHDARAWIDGFPGMCMIEKPVGPRQLLRRIKELISSGATVEQ